MNNDKTVEQPASKALLILPHLIVQNANAISSPLTWGFPSVTAFAGLMTALERRLGVRSGITFYGVGVVCHGFEPQVTRGGYTRSFHLTRNPVLQDGSTAAIIEEGRVHLDITLIFDVELVGEFQDEIKRTQLAAEIGEVIAGMRVAGGSVVPQLNVSRYRNTKPQLQLMAEDEEQRRMQFGRLSRRWLPGFVLVSRDDLLQSRLADLRESMPQATVLDAWLDLSRINYRAERHKGTLPEVNEDTEAALWQAESRSGWIVPIPVGYASLSELYPPGSVSGARDESVSFRFVESIYSIGQWISPHRLTDVKQLFWSQMHDAISGLYLCTNDFHPTTTPSV